MQPFQSVLPGHVRRPLCSYYSQDRSELVKEVTASYLGCRSTNAPVSEPADQQRKLLALLVSTC